MSVRTMARVWEFSTHGGSELLMLLAIADFADDEGNAYPAVPTLAKKCRLGDRYANVLLGKLRDSGELDIRLNEGPKGTNRYRVLPGRRVNDSSPLNKDAPLNQSSSGGELQFLKPLNSGSPEPSLNHQEPPDSAIAKAGRSKSEKKSFKAWYEAAKALNPDFFKENDPIYTYLQSVGLSNDFMLVHWRWFKARQLECKKLQADWPQTFRNSVKGNFGRLWWRTPESTWKLTTAGKQVAIEHGYDENMVAGGPQ